MKQNFVSLLMFAAIANEGTGGTISEPGLPAGAEAIDLRSKKKVFSTVNDPYHEGNDAFFVHPKAAEHLFKMGLAAETEADAKKVKLKSDATTGEPQKDANK